MTKRQKFTTQGITSRKPIKRTTPWVHLVSAMDSLDPRNVSTLRNEIFFIEKSH